MRRKAKNITLDKEVIELAQRKANEFFGGNFSAYINYIIIQDTKFRYMKKDILEDQEDQEIEDIKSDNECINAIDNILKL